MSMQLISGEFGIRLKIKSLSDVLVFCLNLRDGYVSLLDLRHGFVLVSVFDSTL